MLNMPNPTRLEDLKSSCKTRAVESSVAALIISSKVRLMRPISMSTEKKMSLEAIESSISSEMFSLTVEPRKKLFAVSENEKGETSR